VSPQRGRRPPGRLRQSQVITTFGPGALVDLPNYSVLIGGLDQWSSAGQVEVHEPRLVAKLEELLRVQGLRLRTPPLDDQDPTAPKTGVTAWRFPEWFITDVVESTGASRSRLLVHRNALHGGRFIVDDDRKRRYVVPIRFVRACRRGHIGDIDWFNFVHSGKGDCRRQLWVDERGTSGDLSEVWIRCACKTERAMTDAATLATRALGMCNGARLWLGPYSGENCGELNRLLVRTASNAYFPQVLSVISLPDRDDEVVQAVDRAWETLQHIERHDDLQNLRNILPPVEAALSGLDNNVVIEEIRSRRAGGGSHADKPVKRAELEVLLASKEEIGSDVPDGTFYARALPADRLTGPFVGAIDRVVLVHRLREVSAQVSFTRFEGISPNAEGELELGVQPASLAREIAWLPAVENRGEGIFVAFKPDAIDDWMRRSEVIARGKLLMSGFDRWRADHNNSRREFPGLPYVMLHSLSHLLVTAVALECGYPASSIRERVYAGQAGYGILIYTGSPDAEGTLGGLVEAGRRITEYIDAAVDAGNLCSNDPVCAEHNPDNEHDRRFLLGAACHGCLLIAETSCEQHNDFLDRALVVPTLCDPGAAFLAGAQ
jgi:Domain of unknown function (DUF1998)